MSYKEIHPVRSSIPIPCYQKQCGKGKGKVYPIICHEGIEKEYMGADKSLALPGRKQATATEEFEFHTSYL